MIRQYANQLHREYVIYQFIVCKFVKEKLQRELQNFNFNLDIETKN